MSDINLQFQLPETRKIDKFIAKLSKKLDLEIVSQQFSLKSFYDSFDWRLFNADILCELNQSKTASCVKLLDRKTGARLALADIDQVPAFADAFTDRRIKDRLAPLLEMRALLSICTLSLQLYQINVLNKDQKTTVRLLIEAYELLPPRVVILPLKGYEKAAAQISELLEKDLELKAVTKPVLNAALKLQGRKPNDYSSKLNIQLDPEMRADIACKYIYSHLLKAMKVNETGTIADTDSEFLHDFRVAVRRTRSGLSQLKAILPKKVIAQYSEYFAWLGQITSLTRDMDVYLLSFDRYKHSLPEGMQQDLDPLYDFIKRKQIKAQQELAEKLQSGAYLSKLSAWEQYLKEPVPKHATEANAMLKIKQVADQRIWKVYQRVIKDGHAITNRSPAEALHELRKTCKKLRYLMEFFQNLYPPEQIKLLIKALKGFQELLGDFQDYEVQEITLKKFSEEMMAEKTPTETFLAMGVLVQNLHQHRCQAREDFAARFETFTRTENIALFKELFAGKKA